MQRFAPISVERQMYTIEHIHAVDLWSAKTKGRKEICLTSARGRAIVVPLQLAGVCI